MVIELIASNRATVSVPDARGIRETFRTGAKGETSMTGARRQIHMLALAVAVAGLLAGGESASAQARPDTKGLRGGSTTDDAVFQFQNGNNWDLVSGVKDFDTYDARTMQILRNLHADSRPFWEGDHDNEVHRERRATERAFAIQSGRQLSTILNTSELKPIYNDVRSTLSRLQDVVRYSVQSDGSGISVSKKKKGRPLLELNLNFNLKQGLDPQIKMGENLYFRYDWLEGTPLLEYGVRF